MFAETFDIRANSCLHQFSVCLLLMTAFLTASARETVVLVEAHPDDLAGHGGTAILLSEKFDVKVVDFTRGENGMGEDHFRDGSCAKIRVEEEKKDALIRCYVCQEGEAIRGRKEMDSVFRGRRIGTSHVECFAVWEGSVKQGKSILFELDAKVW